MSYDLYIRIPYYVEMKHDLKVLKGTLKGVLSGKIFPDTAQHRSARIGLSENFN